MNPAPPVTSSFTGRENAPRLVGKQSRPCQARSRAEMLPLPFAAGRPDGAAASPLDGGLICAEMRRDRADTLAPMLSVKGRAPFEPRRMAALGAAASVWALAIACPMACGDDRRGVGADS